MREKNQFLVVDAYALLYRANFAYIKRPLLTRDGRNTSAIHGFMRTFLVTLKSLRPTHLAVAFDLKGKTFRHELYPDYKGQRPPAPEAIVYGAERLKELLTVLGVPMVSAAGFEADDVVGSIVHRFADEDTMVYMFTPDKDYQQLLGAHAMMIKPGRRGGEVEEVTVADLLEKYGISEPRQFIDILALWGDASDNVPGVPGIGEKTAATLIAKYGSIECLYGNVGNLPKKQAANFGASQGQLSLSRELVTIRTDAPIPEQLEDYAPKAVDVQGLERMIEELEFSSLGRDMRSYFLGETVEKVSRLALSSYESLEEHPHDYRLVTTEEEFSAMIAAMEGEAVYALDTETTGFSYHSDRLVGMSVSVSPFQGWFLPFAEEGEVRAEWKRELQRVLALEDKRIVGHNLKFDIGMLQGAGYEVRGQIVDTMVLHYLLEPDARHGLDNVSMELLAYKPIAYKDLKPGAKESEIVLREVDIELLRDYAVEDTDVALRLYEAMWPRIEAEGMVSLYQELEAPLVKVLERMEWNGVAVDTERLQQLHDELTAEMEVYRAEVQSVAENDKFNIDSPKQVGELLFDKLKIADKPKKTKTGQYNTSEMEMLRYAEASPVVQTILVYRELRKLLSTYVDSLPKLVNAKSGLIHAHFNQSVATTGRLSSSDPNLQNIPVRTEYGKRIRQAFVSRFAGGTLLSADYSQIELRLMAHMSGDKDMVAAFQEEKDIHAATAAKIAGIGIEDVSKSQREHAKRANFGMVYGISAFGLSQQLDIPVGEAAQFIKDYFAMYPGVEAYMQRTVEEARAKGYAVTLSGRRRPLLDINSQNGMLRSAAERNAINAPIQGTAADIMKQAMVDIWERMEAMGLKSLLTTQVHDELIFDVYPGEKDALLPVVVECMRNAAQLSVPLVVDVAEGGNWGEL